jgi:uncharacterized protein YndB with AHSA1/START domain
VTTHEASIEPVRKQVRVACSIEKAFRTFTEGIGSWWPVATHSISVGEDGSNPPEAVVFETEAGGRVYERARDGRECDWGTVLAYEPPTRLVLEWRVNPIAQTEVEVRFRPDGQGTVVELEHRGWERFADGGEAERSAYDSGWPRVLSSFEDAIGGSAEPAPRISSS